MDLLSSTPAESPKKTPRNLLSATFALTAGVSGAVTANTATPPKFSDQPANAPMIAEAITAQQEILDMLPTNHASRPAIAAAIKALEDGGNTQELTNLFIWANSIVNNQAAPVAAKKAAEHIISVLTGSEGGKEENQEQQQEGIKLPDAPKTAKTLPPLNESPEQKKARLAEERLIKIRDEIIKEFNKDILKKDSWVSLKIGSSNKNNDADATITRDNGGLIFAMKQKNRTFAQASFNKEFLAGKYTMTLEGSDGKYVIYWPGGKEIIIKPGVPTTFEITENKQISFNVLPDRITPEITVSKVNIERAPAKIANN